MVAKIGSVLVLVICSVYDVKFKKIPIRVLALGTVFAVICSVMRYVGWEEMKGNSLWGETAGILVSVAPGIIFLILSFLTEKKVGCGDGLLLMVLGLMEGFKSVLFTCCIGLFLQALTAVVLVVIRKADKQTEIPFVPFLLLARLFHFF